MLDDEGQIPLPRGGTLRNFFVRHNAAVGNGTAVTYTVLKNGVATAIAVSLATGAIAQASDLVDTVAVVAGDRVSISADKPAALGAGGGDLEVEASLELA